MVAIKALLVMMEMGLGLGHRCSGRSWGGEDREGSYEEGENGEGG